jgi:hypothetical protein
VFQRTAGTEYLYFCGTSVSRSLQIAFMLLLFTVHRPSDVLEMTAERVTERDGRMFIAVRRQKTNTLLDAPVHHRLEPLIQQRLAQAKPSDCLVASPHSLPWSRAFPQ